jgi:hypothetical protein
MLIILSVVAIEVFVIILLLARILHEVEELRRHKPPYPPFLP